MSNSDIVMDVKMMNSECNSNFKTQNVTHKIAEKEDENSLSAYNKPSENCKKNRFPIYRSSTLQLSAPASFQSRKNKSLTEHRRYSDLQDNLTHYNSNLEKVHAHDSAINENKQLSKAQCIKLSEIESSCVNSELLSLENLVHLKLNMNSMQPIRLKEMYNDLHIQDLHSTGLIDERQLTLVALKYDLPLKIPTLRMLCRNFSDTNRPHLVCYEKLLNFLSMCTPEHLSQDSVPSQASDVSKSTLESSGLREVLEMHPQNDKVVALLRDQLSGSSSWDLEKLHESLLLADRCSEKRLPADVILDICMTQRVPLTSSLLVKLLEIAEVHRGVIDWREFLAPIIRACVDPTLLNETESSLSQENEQKSADLLQRRGRKWLRNFTQLTAALKSHNPFETDRLPHRTVERMLLDYNVLYELGFSSHQLAEALQKAVVEEKTVNYESVQIVSIDHLLKALAQVDL